MAVFVLDKQKRPLMPCTEKRARLLLERGRAVVVRLAPFTIRLKGVRAEVPKGKKAGVHVGRVAVRRTGSFNIQTQGGTVRGISYRHCRLLQRADGYGYSFQPKPNTEEARRAA
ncbi:hypothetical protein Atep_31520 (plasmid) [Allochromatium tepidum]|uniref:RRXRR domain-containing protein n=1 Tax=Allochromatium tepidum TaxID=553982 RepID=A0ABM7QRP7_9GAMM|nr:hypothetical protein Atep_31520 [Allochromatium tepidum]